MQLLWVGIGCRRGTSRELIESAIAQVLNQYGLCENQIVGVATVDRKSDETGLLEYCEAHQFPLSLFSVEELSAIVVPNPSIDRIGTPSVAEAAAILATGSNRLIVPKLVIENRVTIAIAPILDKLKSIDLAAEHEANCDRFTDFNL
ncbi:cobalamin biosynthesis protein [Leptolyngbya sp. NIES-2104]|uniref:cobalamin biosynthesis protein n=1 Tax=Leptolyngbya sp. NIES-2104 TaxID=1552121 RepID=UPI0006EC99B7|nr:cobalamin biosynthesis protein [Leptolyngbya sp. NIES-2104]GAP97715.1 cobalamin biosynthesis protein CbiG / Cobalt-precorrin-3b C17-methyltransferase [Leptolyngbya sp. NIES-2104]